jgi:RNA polymerase sigma factor (sigma-70 family)
MQSNEVNDLIKSHKEGNKVATEKLIKLNTGLVHKIANKYRSHPAYNPDDVYQEGLMGLIKSFDKFDPEKDIKLSTYACWWIRSYIRKFLIRNRSMVRRKNKEHKAMSFSQDLYIEDFQTKHDDFDSTDYVLYNIIPDLVDNETPEVKLERSDKLAIVEDIKVKVKKKLSPKKLAILESMLKNDFSPTQTCEEFGMSRQGVEQQMNHLINYIKRLGLKYE